MDSGERCTRRVGKGTAVVLYNTRVEDIGDNNLLEVLHELYMPISSGIKSKSIAGWTQERDYQESRQGHSRRTIQCESGRYWGQRPFGGVA